MTCQRYKIWAYSLRNQWRPTGWDVSMRVHVHHEMKTSHGSHMVLFLLGDWASRTILWNVGPSRRLRGSCADFLRSLSYCLEDPSLPETTMSSGR